MIKITKMNKMNNKNKSLTFSDLQITSSFKDAKNSKADFSVCLFLQSQSVYKKARAEAIPKEQKAGELSTACKNVSQKFYLNTTSCM